LINIVLHGELARKYGKTFSLAVSTASEAVRALCFTVPGFKDDFFKYDYSVYAKNGKQKQYIDEDTLASPVFADSVHLVPVLSGSKSNTQKGVQKIVIAAALFFVAGPVGSAFGAKVGAVVTNAAVFLTLNGITALLTPKPPKEVAPNESSQISADASVTGVAVPLAYGETYFDVLPISVEISSSGMNLAGGGGSTVPGGINWTWPEYTDAFL
jgi:predicted phage tail protein